jgi:peptide/nickel transport system substrate-binding protein
MNSRTSRRPCDRLLTPRTTKFLGIVLVLMTTASAVAVAAAVAQRSSGGTLTVAEAFPINDTNPYPLGEEQVLWRRAVFNNLVTIGRNGQPVPELATSWKASNNDRVFVFTIRKGVKFSDGLPLTATAVAWNITYAEKPATGAQAGGQFAGAVATAVGDLTLKIRFPVPTPQVFSALSDIPIIRPSTTSTVEAIGTGPFVIDHLSPGRELDLSRNPSYWRSGYPKVDKLVLKTVPDPSTQILNLQSGAADLIPDVPFSQIASLAKSGFRIVSVPGTGNDDFLLNTTARALSNKLVREALSLAVDRKRFNAVALNGRGRPTCLAFPPASPVYSKAMECKFDLARAKKLLARAGYAKGLTLKLQVPTNLPPIATFAPIYKADLAKIGVNLQLQNLAPTDWVNLLVSRTFPSLIGHVYSYGSLDPALLMTANPFDLTQNFEHFRSAEYTRLVKKAEATTGTKQRIKAFQAVQKLIRDQAFMIPIANEPAVFAMSKKVQGFKTTALDLADYEGVSVG